MFAWREHSWYRVILRALFVSEELRVAEKVSDEFDMVVSDRSDLAEFPKEATLIS